MSSKKKKELVCKELRLIGIIFNDETNESFVKALRQNRLVVEYGSFTSTNNLRLETSEGIIYFQTDCNTHCGTVKLDSKYQMSLECATEILDTINEDELVTILGFKYTKTPGRQDILIEIKLEYNTEGEKERKMSDLANKMNLKFGKAPYGFGLNMEGKIAFDGKVYNTNTSELEDSLDLVFGEDMLYVMPVNASDLKVGDVIVIDNIGKQVIEAKKILKVADLKTGEIQTLAKRKLFGLSFYSKIISPFGDLSNTNNQNMLPFLMLAKDGDRDDMLPLLLMTQNGKDNNMNTMLPLMLLADKGGDNDMLAIMMMMQNQNGGSNMNNMLPLLMLDRGKDAALMMMMMMQNNQKPLNNNKKDSE